MRKALWRSQSRVWGALQAGSGTALRGASDKGGLRPSNTMFLLKGIWWATMINHWFFGVWYFQTNTKNWDSIWFYLSFSGGFTTEPTKTIRNRDQKSSKRDLMGWMSHLLTNHKDQSRLRHFKDPFIIVLGVCPARIKLHNCRSVKSSEGFTLHGASTHKRIIKNPYRCPFPNWLVD